MAAPRFEVVQKANGSGKKLSARISNTKDMDITALNNKAYLHISDKKSAFKDNGKFNKSAVKTVSLSMSEVQTIKEYLLDIDSQVQQFLSQIEQEASVQQPEHFVLQPVPDLIQQQPYQQGPSQQQLPQPGPSHYHQQPGASQQQPYQQGASQQQLHQPGPSQSYQQYQENVFDWAPYQNIAAQQQQYQPSWNVQQQPHNGLVAPCCILYGRALDICFTD